MDYEEGRSHKDALHEAGTLPESAVLLIFEPIAAALDYETNNGINLVALATATPKATHTFARTLRPCVFSPCQAESRRAARL